ncbi:hypothetical protein F5Y08DRAFT_244159 [Xylaria arbuscula]|nr:hypothetical protein F5Y08DRAFT_244159 [Xylaria arbuscula]
MSARLCSFIALGKLLSGSGSAQDVSYGQHCAATARCRLLLGRLTYRDTHRLPLRDGGSPPGCLPGIHAGACSETRQRSIAFSCHASHRGMCKYGPLIAQSPSQAVCVGRMTCCRHSTRSGLAGCVRDHRQVSLCVSLSNSAPTDHVHNCHCLGT